MMFLEGHCPYCNEKRGFNIFSISGYRGERTLSEISRQILDRNEASLSPMQKHKSKFESKTNKPARCWAAGTCILCFGGVLLELEIEDGHYRFFYDSVFKDNCQYGGIDPIVKCIVPNPAPPYSHPALPINIRELFVDLQVMLKENLAPPLIITGCRSILEEAVKKLGGKGGTLFQRIADLRSKAIVNGVLEEWSSHIRSMGNEAVHELKGTREEADELVEFTKLFLQYTFEFPARVQELRGKNMKPTQ